MKLSIIKGFIHHSEDVDIEEIVRRIKSDQFKIPITFIRANLEGRLPTRLAMSVHQRIDDANRRKKNLPAFTPSGTFSGGRSLSTLQEYSGLIHLDYDNVEDVESLFSHVCRHPLTYLAFRSPSGNGVKVFAKVVHPNPKQHLHYWEETELMYRNWTRLFSDPKCKDLARLCFFSYDPNLYFNPMAYGISGSTDPDLG